MPALPWARRAPRWSASEPTRGTRRLRSAVRARHVRLAVLGLVAAAALLGGGWLWFQDSSFVSVEHVAVTGPSGPDAAAIRAALDSAARSMTTLDVQTSRLYGAVSGFPVVKKLEVSAQFPHGMRIHVVEELPVAVVTAGGSKVGVAGDGTLLRDLATLPALPRIQLAVPPGGPRVTEPGALSALAAANAAPRPLLSRITIISASAQHGIVAQLRDGPAVYLGDTSELEAKWNALVAVLADAGSAGASYIDVTDPGRPAAGVSGGAGAGTNAPTAPAGGG